MALIGGVPASYDKCLITWTLKWDFVWICLYVSPFLPDLQPAFVCIFHSTVITVIIVLGYYIYLQNVRTGIRYIRFV